MELSDQCSAATSRVKKCAVGIWLGSLVAFASVPVVAQTPPVPESSAIGQPAVNPQGASLSAFVKARRFEKCVADVARFENIVLKDHEYSFSAHVDERKTRSQLVTALVDARHRSSLARSLFNVTFVIATEGKGCSIAYERTQYYAERCDAVQRAVAPSLSNLQRPAFGALLLDVNPMLTVALIPVGSNACVSVMKEVAF